MGPRARVPPGHLLTAGSRLPGGLLYPHSVTSQHHVIAVRQGGLFRHLRQEAGRQGVGGEAGSATTLPSITLQPTS